MKTNKKALTLVVTFGLIFAVVLLVLSFEIIADFIHPFKKDYDKSFQDFVKKVKVIGAGEKGVIDSPGLVLEKDTILIGLSAVDISKKNGRFYDGDFHLIAAEDIGFMSSKKVKQPSQGSGGLIRFSNSLHYERPVSLSDAENYLCLCKNVQLEEVDESYTQGLIFTEEKESPYKKLSSLVPMPLDSKQKTLAELFVYPNNNNYRALKIVCAEEICESIGKQQFYPLHRSTYYSISEERTEDYFIYEGGFIIDRIGLAYEFDSSSTFKVPESPPLIVSKLSNSELAFCFEPSCVDILEAALTTDKHFSQPPQKADFDCATQTPPGFSCTKNCVEIDHHTYEAKSLVDTGPCAFCCSKVEIELGGKKIIFDCDLEVPPKFTCAQDCTKQEDGSYTGKTLTNIGPCSYCCKG
jgi:hypothetical protein